MITRSHPRPHVSLMGYLWIYKSINGSGDVGPPLVQSHRNIQSYQGCPYVTSRSIFSNYMFTESTFLGVFYPTESDT